MTEENGLLNELNENTGTVISTVLYTHKFLCVETVEIYGMVEFYPWLKFYFSLYHYII